MKFIRIWGVIPAIVIIMTSCQCSLFEPENPLDIRVDVAWRAEVYQDANLGILIDGNIGYIPQDNGVVAVNLDNGSILWRRTGEFRPDSNIEKIGNFIYVFESHFPPAPDAISNDIAYIRIAKISTDGKSLEMVIAGEQSVWYPRMFYHSSDDTHLYWGTYQLDMRARLVKFNPITLDKSIIFTTTNNFKGKILIDDNKVYAGHFHQEIDNLGTLTVINLEDNSIVWEKTPKLSKYFGGNSLYITNELLYILDSRGTALYNKNTGEEIFDTTNAKGGFYGGCVIDGDYLYFTSPYFEREKVCCVNRWTGEVKWSDDRGYSLGASPQINQGILYVDGIDHLRLYDAATGEVVGIDTTIKGMTYQLAPSTARYKDLMIICGDEGITAVRMNYHTKLKRSRSKR